jgi:hypothetical protein
VKGAQSVQCRIVNEEFDDVYMLTVRRCTRHDEGDSDMIDCIGNEKSLTKLNR